MAVLGRVRVLQVGKVGLNKLKFSKQKWNEYSFTHALFNSWNIPIVLLGLLLGRAMILHAIAPFAVAYCAVFLYLSRNQWSIAMISVVLGALSIDYEHALRILFLLSSLMGVHRCFLYFSRSQINYLPLVVLLSNILGHAVYLQLFQDFSSYNIALSSTEILLSLILSIIFVQAIPIFTVKRQRIALHSEEVLCLVILLGSVMTGMLGLDFMGLSIIHVVSRYFVLIFALTGGAMLGTFIGVLLGIILSLSDISAMAQVSLLAFSGLLAGIFREGRRVSISVAFMLGSAMVSFYDVNNMFGLSLQESFVAVVLFLCTPRRLMGQVAKYIPGTQEYQSAQQDYLRRLRDITVSKVEQFKDLFEELAFNFREDKSKERRDNEEEMQLFVQSTMQNTCMGCRRQKVCWEENFLGTYNGITDLMMQVEEANNNNIEVGPEHISPGWSRYCVKSEQMLEDIKQEYTHRNEQKVWQSKVKDSQRVVSEQLIGLSEVMANLTKEIRHETQVLVAHEEQIHAALESLGLAIGQVDIINLEQGKVEIEVTMPMKDGLEECQKIVAPMLSDILGEPITVFKKVLNDRAYDATILLGSAQQYDFKLGVAKAAKDGKYISGDSYCYMNLGTGKYVIALSDGMGNGSRAYEESTSALKLLRKLLYAGMDFERSIETINSILRLRSTDEMFATIDLAVIDMNTAKARFLKIGCTPGFIKRKREVFPIAVSAPPIGILQKIEIDPIDQQLESGDLLVMMTDGLYDAIVSGDANDSKQGNQQELVINAIMNINTKDPQDFADQLLSQVIKEKQGQVHDDMTVIVSKIDKYHSEWSTINLAGAWRLDRVG